MKKIIGLVLVTVIAAAAVVGVASAQAQTPNPPVPQAASVPFLGNLMQIIADDLGVQPRDILSQMRGQTLSQVIQANNGDLTQISSDIVTAVTDRVNQAVADGQITQDRADQILSDLDTTVQDALNGNPGRLLLRGLAQGGFGQRFPMQGGFGQGFPMQGGLGQGFRMQRPSALNLDAMPLIDAAHNATGLTGREIMDQMRSGKTLSEIITAKGGDPAAVEDAAIATATQRLDQIRANGNLTQDQENSMLDGLRAFYDAVLNGAFRQPTPAAQGAI